MLASRHVITQGISLKCFQAQVSSSTLRRCASGIACQGYNKPSCQSKSKPQQRAVSTAAAPALASPLNQQSDKIVSFPPTPTLPYSQVCNTPSAWPHPLFKTKDMEEIEVAHRPTKTFSDTIALGAVRFLRNCMDFATGYKPHVEGQKSIMTERKWLIRFIFLESVAGVPGMVGGMLRHLHSLRRLKRDNGWIESLIEEAYNERMHLLTFLKLQTPGLFMRTMILGAQGVFFNGFFLCYLMSPRTCHRFVGYLEEEAVLTYSHALAEMDQGELPVWNKMQAPQIAIEYWNMPEGKRTMKDLLLYVRADEAKHREVNHTLGNLDQTSDPNPFNSEFVDPEKPHPNKGLRHNKAIGWSREEAL